MVYIYGDGLGVEKHSLGRVWADDRVAQLSQLLYVMQRAPCTNICEIRCKTIVKDIIEKIKEAKWRWAGHIA